MRSRAVCAVQCAILCSADWGKLRGDPGIKSGESICREYGVTGDKGKDMRDLLVSFLVTHPVKGMRRVICRDDQISRRKSQKGSRMSNNCAIVGYCSCNPEAPHKKYYIHENDEYSTHEIRNNTPPANKSETQ